MDKYIPESVELFVKEDDAYIYCENDIAFTSEVIMAESKRIVESYKRAIRANRTVGTILILIGLLSVWISGGDCTALIFIGTLGVALLFAKTGWITGFEEIDDLYEKTDRLV